MDQLCILYLLYEITSELGVRVIIISVLSPSLQYFATDRPNTGVLKRFYIYFHFMGVVNDVSDMCLLSASCCFCL